MVEQAGEIDILIANAGRPGGWALDDTSSTRSSRSIRVNFEVPIHMAKAVIPQMKQRGKGQIVLIASLAGKFALPDSTMYSSTKAGLRAFGWALRPELAKDGIGVNVVTPGFISEVGMFAKRKRKAPPLAGTISPKTYTPQAAQGHREERRRDRDRAAAAARALTALADRAEPVRPRVPPSGAPAQARRPVARAAP